jgi:hypothetical protein
MLMWEQQPQNTKTNLDLAKAYFEAIVKATDTYEQNVGGGDTKHNKYKSAHQMADYGIEIREYIQKLAITSAAATNSAANVQTKDKLLAMEDKIKKLHAIIEKMSTKINNKENQCTNGGGSNGGQDGGKFGDARRPQIETWADIAIHMVSTQLEQTMTAPPAVGKRPTTSAKPHGRTEWAGMCFGPAQNVWPSNNTTQHLGKERPHPATEINWGLQQVKSKRLTMPHFLKLRNVYHPIFTTAYPRHHARLKSTNPTTNQLSQATEIADSNSAIPSISPPQRLRQHAR